MALFQDRVDAGRQLALRLTHLQDQDVVVLGLPRGGVPVAAEVANALRAPLDVIVVRKLGVPVQPELAMGAIGEGGARVVNTDIVSRAGIDEKVLSDVEAAERAQLEERVNRYRKGSARIDLTGRTAVIVDDGLATGSTARAACQVARQLGAASVILAVPVAPEAAVRGFEAADEFVCASAEPRLAAVGFHYRDFRPTTDDEVMALLAASAGRLTIDRPVAVPGCDLDVDIAIGDVILHGHLHIPSGASGVVVFAHGSGSGRHSPRNRFVADELNRARLGTLLLDLLTPAEELDRRMVFDTELLAGRLTAVTTWLCTRPETMSCSVGYFGASTGAAAALWAAADAGSRVAAIVSRGGRPDLAGARLAQVRAPTLLVVGSKDEITLMLNRRAQAMLRCPNRLTIVEGAGHLFQEPGTLTEAARHARDWFGRYLPAAEHTDVLPL